MASEEFFAFHCPECVRKLRTEASRAGETIHCPSCKARIRIPCPPGGQPVPPPINAPSVVVCRPLRPYAGAALPSPLEAVFQEPTREPFIRHPTWLRRNAFTLVSTAVALSFCVYIASLFGSATAASRVSSPTPAPTLAAAMPQPRQPSRITWNDYRHSCGLEAHRLNGVRSETAFENIYRGTCVRWSGTIMSIDKGRIFDRIEIGIRMSPTESRILPDICLMVPLEANVNGLNKGDDITFKAIVADQGGEFSPHYLRWTD